MMPSPFTEQASPCLPYSLRLGERQLPYANVRRAAGSHGVATMTLEGRFWSKVDKSGGPDACWPWIAYRDPDGYGKFRIGSRTDRTQTMVSAHRFAWTLVNGAIHQGMNILHRCDNPPCVNVARCLFLGDQAANIADMVSKGRLVSLRGEANGFAKLTAAAIQEIRAMLEAGHLQREIAGRFGTSQQNISRIAHGARWACAAAIEGAK